jgi:hypothetical protein
MDGRLVTVLVAFLAPAALIALTVIRFSSNPIALIGEFVVMIAGGLYLLTYSDTFGA